MSGRTRRRDVPAAILTLVVGLVLVAVMAATAPDLTVAPRAWSRLTVGETGTIRDLSLTVTQVRVARTMTVRDTTMGSEGVFVVVGGDVAAVGEPTFVNNVWLATKDGRRYDPRGEWSSARPVKPVQPGFAGTGDWVFEVPPGRLAGAELVVENDGAEFDWFDSGLRVDLGLDGGGPDPTTWEPRPVTLAPGSVRVLR